MLSKQHCVKFADNVELRTFHTAHEAITVTYNSGADGNYVSKKDRHKVMLLILCRSTKKVVVIMAKGMVWSGKNIT